tara:strand:+ start:597 stop:1700 length:1104 start_codon:yes stop_codon:yes gene_type:complete
MNNIKKIITQKYSITDFKSIKDRWNKLYIKSENNNPFLSPLWIESYFKFFNKRSRNYSLILVSINQKDDLIGMIIENSLLRSKFLKDNEHIDYSGILVDFKIINNLNLNYSNIFKGINKNLIELNSTPEIKNIKKIFTDNKLYLNSFRRTINPIIDLEKDFNFYINTRSKKLKQEIRTISNKQINGKKFNYKVAISKKEKYEKLKLLYKFHLERQDNKVGNSIFLKKENRNFYEFIVLESTFSELIHLSYLDYDQKTISVVLSIVINDYYYYWIPSFDKIYSKLSPGKYHIYLLISECYKKKMKEFNFMGGEEKYKLQWSNRSYNLYNYWGTNNFLVYIILKIIKKLFYKIQRNKIIIEFKNYLIKI